MTAGRGARPRPPRLAGAVDRAGAVRLRLSGEPADVIALLDALIGAGVELTGTTRPYTNTRSTGVRVYTQARLPAAADTWSPPADEQ